MCRTHQILQRLSTSNVRMTHQLFSPVIRLEQRPCSLLFQHKVESLNTDITLPACSYQSTATRRNFWLRFLSNGRLFPHDDKKYTRVNVETSAPEQPHKLYYLPPGSWGRCCLSGWRLLNEFISGLKTSSPFFFFLLLLPLLLLLLLSIAVYIKQFLLSVSFAVHIRLGCNPACYYMTNTNWLWWSRRCGWELSWKPVALAWLKLFFNQGGLY